MYEVVIVTVETTILLHLAIFFPGTIFFIYITMCMQYYL